MSVGWLFSFEFAKLTYRIFFSYSQFETVLKIVNILTNIAVERYMIHVDILVYKQVHHSVLLSISGHHDKHTEKVYQDNGHEYIQAVPDIFHILHLPIQFHRHISLAEYKYHDHKSKFHFY